MKKAFSLLFIILFALSFGQNNRSYLDKLGVPGPIEFNNNEYFLDIAVHPSETYFFQQYLPRDENYDKFNEILGISYFVSKIDIETAVRKKVQMIQDRKEDKYAKVEVTQSPDGTEFIVDYTISDVSKDKMAFAEYNIYRFKYNDHDKNLVIFSYAKRIYGDVRFAVKEFGKQRNGLMQTMIEFKIPTIRVNPKDLPKPKLEEKKTK